MSWNGPPVGGTPPSWSSPEPIPVPPPKTPWYNRAAVIVPLVVVAMVATLAAGFVGYRVLYGTEELTERQYARQLCNDAVEPKAKELEDAAESRNYERLRSADISRTSEAESAIQAGRTVLMSQRELVAAIGEFNEQYQLSGSDGEEFRADLTDAIDDWLLDLEDVLTDVNELDPSDEEDVSEQFLDAVEGLGGLGLDVEEDPLVELLDDMDEEDCATPLATVLGDTETLLDGSSGATSQNVVVGSEESEWIELFPGADTEFEVRVSWPEAIDVDFFMSQDGETLDSNGDVEEFEDNELTLFGYSASDSPVELEIYNNSYDDEANVSVELIPIS